MEISQKVIEIFSGRKYFKLNPPMYLKHLDTLVFIFFLFIGHNAFSQTLEITATANKTNILTPTVVCSITPTYTVTCNNQGTSDVSDDKYDLVITVNGSDTPSGSFWQSDNASISNGSYGATKNLPNFALISAGPVTVTFTDSQNSSCSQTLTITPPASCSPPCS